MPQSTCTIAWERVTGGDHMTLTITSDHAAANADKSIEAAEGEIREFLCRDIGTLREPSRHAIDQSHRGKPDALTFRTRRARATTKARLGH